MLLFDPHNACCPSNVQNIFHSMDLWVESVYFGFVELSRDRYIYIWPLQL